MRGLFVIAAVCAWAAQLPAQSSVALVDYNRQVHAVFAERCLVCHSQEKRSGGLSLATYDDVLNGGRSGAAVKPGNSGASVLVQRITGPAESRMPAGGPALGAAEIGIITAWIDQGARATPQSAAAKPKWEAPLALERPKTPASPWKEWTDPLDRFTATYLAAHGVPEPAPVSDAVFARRVYLDVQGLLPPPEELRAFRDDGAADKRRRLVERLLADSRKYSENWISYWNDLLRNDDGVTYYSETAGRKSITPWLMAALESNLPYNQWVSRLLNPQGPADPEGFLIGVNWRGTVSASQSPAVQAAQNTAQIFLGINLKCNSCHDSFISKWKLKDAYALAAYFSTEEQLRLYRCDVAQEQFASAGFLFPELNRAPASGAVADRRAAAAAIFTDPRNGRMPRTIVNRIWQKLMGRGIVENVDEMDDEPWSPELLDLLAADFVAGGYDLKALIARILESRTYQMPAVARTGEEKEYVFRGPELRRLTAEQFSDAVAAITGDWQVLPGRATGGGKNDENQPVPVPPGSYVRGWRIPGSSLERALGRPIRDQVYSTRETQATTIQALELVNGETLTHWLWRGSRKMLGELAAEPAALVARQANAGRPPVPFEVNIANSEKLYLIVRDSLSTAPEKAAPLWVGLELAGPRGVTPLASLKPLDASGLRGEAAGNDLRVKLNSVVEYDIAGQGFTTLRGAPGHESGGLPKGENVQARFFVFDRRPDMDRLVPPNPETPLPSNPTVMTPADAVDRVYLYALGRMPGEAERRTAEAALRDPARPGKVSADGLADLLWALTMTPEFQFVR